MGKRGAKSRLRLDTPRRLSNGKYNPEYFKKYYSDKERHVKLIQTVKQSQCRRRRDYPSDIILNEKFKGSVLHHLTPNTCMYIPVSVHRAVFHNLRTGEGIKEINTYALTKLLL